MLTLGRNPVAVGVFREAVCPAIAPGSRPRAKVEAARAGTARIRDRHHHVYRGEQRPVRLAVYDDLGLGESGIQPCRRREPS
jgi:hypothetical protein